MRVIFPTSQTRQFYDRNTISRLQKYEATGVAPTGITQRWTYTVPGNTKAVITALYIFIRRQTAAAPVGRIGAEVVLNPLSTNMRIAKVEFVNNTVDAILYEIIPCQIWLTSGDRIDGNTYDTSTGGTVEFNVNAEVLEFGV